MAEVISRPRYFEEHTAQRLEGLTEELGAAVTEQALTSILEQIVFETGAARRAPRHAVTEVIETVARELTSSWNDLRLSAAALPAPSASIPQG